LRYAALVITRSRQLALLLFDEVELLDFAGALQMLTLAGRQWNWRPFKIHTVTENPGLITTCNQLRIEAPLALSACPQPEIVIVPGGYGATLAAKRAGVVSWLSNALDHAEACCTVGSGALVVSATGKLAGQTVSVPPAVATSLQGQNSPLVTTTVERLVIQPKLLSVRSSEGSVDLGLAIVERFLGASLKRRVQADLLLTSGEPAVDPSTLLDEVSDNSRR
jgi:transcriptional regulator GlxA family with amidase domain